MVCVLGVLLLTFSNVLGADVQVLHRWTNSEDSEVQQGSTDGIYAGFFAHLSAHDQNNDSVGWCVAPKTPGKKVRIVSRNPFRKYARLRACRYHDCVRYAPTKMPSGWKVVHCATVQDFIERGINFARSNTNGDGCKFELSDCDDEDDDLVSFKKYDNSQIFALFAAAPAVIYLHRIAKASLPFCNHLASSASDKCIVLRVMRI
ncbi:hypothetical protein DN068_01125 [Taibaiella soli]|uniref:Uncharacterized protein n=2 Tax=Taibaiella soli TaxID=1649169 RepID=A0A2W2BEZ1_9BACT|nr:hypothetical protein DN068_01125 [Taibaiella soli]